MEYEKAFDELKYRLTTAPILVYPDYRKEFILATDASYKGFGATLSQLSDDKKEHPIAYASKSLKKEEVNYGATELECAAIVWAIEHFHKYFGTSHFTLVTGHSALKWLKSSQPKGRLGRWIMKLQPYHFTIIHKPGEFIRMLMLFLAYRPRHTLTLLIPHESRPISKPTRVFRIRHSLP